MCYHVLPFSCAKSILSKLPPQTPHIICTQVLRKKRTSGLVLLGEPSYAALVLIEKKKRVAVRMIAVTKTEAETKREGHRGRCAINGVF